MQWCLQRISHTPATNLKANGMCLLLPLSLIRFKEVRYLTSANSHCQCSYLSSFYFEISEAVVFFSWGQLVITAAVYFYEWSASVCPSVTHFHYNVSVSKSSDSSTVTHEPTSIGKKSLYISAKINFYLNVLWEHYSCGVGNIYLTAAL